jgi:excisionase family DNA binding protein
MPHILSTTEELQNFITIAVALGIKSYIPVLETKFKIEEKEVYSLEQAAKYLNMSPHTLRKKVEANKITFIQDERPIQFRRKHLDEYLDNRTIYKTGPAKI